MTEECEDCVDFIEVAKERRSVFHFDPDRDLADDLLKKIINLAVLAPSSYNMQPWRIIAVKSQEKRQEVYDKACSQQKVLDAPVLLIILGDKEGYKRKNPIWDEKIRLGKLNEEKVRKVIKRNEKSKQDPLKATAYAVRNSSLLAMSIMLTAQRFGVNTHPMIGFNAADTRKLFDLGENIEVTMMISAGYFDQNKELKPRETRFKYDDIVEEY